MAVDAAENPADLVHAPVSLGGYRLSALLGRGASATVWRAAHGADADMIAIKLAHAGASSTGLAREAAVLQQLQRAGHPGLVRLHSAGGVFEGRRWLAMECLHGDGFSARYPRGRAVAPAELMERLATAAWLADALAHAHGLGLVHGDLAPGNVLFRDKQPVLVDWGAACPCASAALVPAAESGSDSLGTAGFVAPERLRGEAYDSRADLYSLGCLLYELVTGQPPFVSDDLAALERAHLYAQAVAPSRVVPWLPRELDGLILGLLAKEPAERSPYARQVALRLAALSGRPCQPARPLLPLFRPRLIERDDTLDAALVQLRQSAFTGFGVTVLRAPSGAGGSRLGLELEARAALGGYASLRLAHAVKPLAAFEPLIERVAEQLAAHGCEPLETQALAALRPYSALLRGVVQSQENQERAPRSREQVFHALVTCLRIAARGVPLCVFVDPLESTGDLGVEFFVALRAQPPEGLRCHVFIITVAELQPSAAVELAPLSEGGCHALLAELLGQPVVGPGLGALLRAASDGLPARVVEWAQRMVREGALGLDERGELTVDHARSARLSADCDALPLELDARVAQIATLAAACGTSFELPLLMQALTAHDPSLLPLEAPLAALVANGILHAQGVRYRFARDAYRRACLAYGEASERVGYHRLLARVLARQPYGNRDYAELGRQWSLAGEPQLAQRCFSLAARRAELALASGDAIAHLRCALELVAHAHAEHAPWPARALRLALRLLEALSKAARHDELLALGERLLARTPASAVLLRVRAAQLIAQSHRIQGDYPAAQNALGLAELGMDPKSPRDLRMHRAWLETQLQHVCLAYMRRDLAAMRRRLLAMVRPMQIWGLPEQLATYKMWCANELVLSQRYAFVPKAVQLERAALRITQRMASSSSRAACMCQFDLAFMLLLGGRESCLEASAVLLEAEQRAKPLGDAVLMARITTYRALALRRLRDHAGCEHYARLALQHASACRLRGYLGAVHGCLAWLALQRDEPARARQLCDEADAQFSAAAGSVNEDYPFQWIALLPRLALEFSEDRLEAARTTLGRLLRDGQARLAAPLDDALRDVYVAWAELDDERIARRLAVVVRTATQLCYL